MSGVEYNPETKIYSCHISIGDKEPLSPERFKSAFNRAIFGVLGRWQKEQEKKMFVDFTSMLFWVEEGWI